MAYNPFNIFRRHQRAIFAVITVVIMFMFVLSSGMTGKADFFNWLPDWIRGKTKTGDSICSLEGSRIYPRDVEALRFQRVVANKFLMYASRLSSENIQKSLIDLQAKATPNIVQRLGQTRQFEQMGLAPKGSYEKEVQGILDSPDSKQSDKDMIRGMRVMSDFSQAQQRFSYLGSYLNAVPNRADRDLVEFMLWEKKAKQLGITFGAEDVKQSLIQKEFLGQLTDDATIRKALREEYRDRYTDDMCFSAIAAEFRVRSAQNAVMGLTERSDYTLNATMTQSAPYEVFDFYREKTSPTTYQALRVPVEAFIPQITAMPTEDEIRRLFDDRQSYEPDPSKELPGFREPRKVKVEWVSLTGEEPYYKKAAADWQTRTELLAKSEVRGLIVPFPGTGIAAAFHVAAPAALKEPLVHEKYRRDVLNAHEGRVGFGWSGITSLLGFRDILETSTVQPQVLVALAGGSAGSIPGGSMMVPVSLLYSATLAADQKARIKACMPLFLGAVPGPSILPTMIGGEVAFRKNVPEALSIAAYKPVLLKEMSEEKARELALADLRNLKKSIDDLKDTGKARESAAKDLVADFVKTRGVKSGASADFQGEYTIGDDPGLAPLKSLKDKGLDGQDPHSGLGAMAGPIQFGKAFFWKSRSREVAAGNYIPEFYPERAGDAPSQFSPVQRSTDPVFLTWRTADQKERGSSITEAKPRVIEAWKRIKARDLAKAEADRLAESLRSKPPVESRFLINSYMLDMQGELLAKTTNPKAKELEKVFFIDNVSPFQITRDTSGMRMGGGGEMVVPFSLAPTNDIPYPTAEMNKQLLEERTKPVKTVLVQADQPKDSYYVVVLADRTVKDSDSFKRDVFNAFSRSSIGGQINGEAARVAFGKARDSVIALLKKEFKYEETEEQKKRFEDRQKNSIDD